MSEIFPDAVPPDVFALCLDGVLPGDRWPGEGTAVSDGTRSLTHRELAEEVMVGAASLADRNLSPGTLVGIPARNTVDSVVAVLSALASGTAFFPLGDPEAVSPRVRALLAGVLPVTGAAHQATADALGVPALTLDRASAERTRAYVARRSAAPLPDDTPAYVIATSGTSGEPKEPMVTRGGLRAVFAALRGRLDTVLPVGARWTHSHPLTFGYAICEILGCAVFGGELAVVSRDGHDGQRTLDLLLDTAANDPTRPHVLCLTPSELALLTDRVRARPGTRLPSHLLLSGEPLHKAPLEEVFALPGGDQVTLVNTYAATETSGQVTVATVGRDDLAEAREGWVGSVLPGVRVRLRDARGRIVPERDTEVSGEIHVAGPTVAARYLSDEQTAARFRTAPEDGGREYATGDLGRWSARGLYVLGRSDRSVKIAGRWLSLDAVERWAAEVPGAEEVAALPDRLVVDGEPVYDCVHVIVRPGAAGPGQEARLRARIVGQLPFRVAVRLTLVDRFPRLPSGKTDLRTLARELAARQADPEVVAGDLRRTVLGVWSTALGAGVATDTPVLDLGVDSLGLTAVARALTRALGRDIPVTFLLDHPRIDLQIAALAGRSESEDLPEQSPRATRADHGARRRSARLGQRRNEEHA
ncbi:non-ribosomal peptide synthetase [Streptomyces sp. NPDC057702]|uniref:non-ribosomal peptide synthetase n=1 Tax=unclassified Streptomyces TaxID=2593676 RepID=UPI003697AFE1